MLKSIVWGGGFWTTQGLAQLIIINVDYVICFDFFSTTFQEGDIVNLDVSIYYQGFHSDLNETFFIGAWDEVGIELVVTPHCLCRKGGPFRWVCVEMKRWVRTRGCLHLPLNCLHFKALAVVFNYLDFGVSSLYWTCINCTSSGHTLERPIPIYTLFIMTIPMQKIWGQDEARFCFARTNSSYT